MLDWLGSRSDDLVEDAPETPAHLFAVKAFKSALFGTPAPARIDLTDDAYDSNEVTSGGAPALRPSLLEIPITTANPAQSPAKGILLTPGTMGARRKTVSFGACKEQTDSDPKNRTVSAPQPLASSTAPNVRPFQQKATRRSLFREGTASLPKDGNAAKPEVQTGTTAKVDLPSDDEDVVGDSGADLTIDLQKPRSVSGKHWMEAYHRDHNTSKAEMKKLIRYSQMAKDHASVRDRETSRLKDKLRKSEARVHELEGQLRIFLPGGGPSDETYKGGVGPGVTDRVPVIARLQKAAKEAMVKAANLEQENENFKKTILRVKEEMGKYEERHKIWVEQRGKKDERHTEQRKALKEKIVRQKTQYTELLREVAEEAATEKAALRREIDFLRGEVTSMSPSKFTLPTRDSKARKEATGKPKDIERQKSRAKSLQQHEKAQVPDSSPTILDYHLARASGNTPVEESSLVPELRPAEAPKKRSPSTKALIDLLNGDVLVEDADSSLPRLPANKNVRPTIKTKKGLRVKPKPTTPGRAASKLPPDREAAARLRIAQRSAEKQKDTRFVFDTGKQSTRPLIDALSKA